MMDEKMLKLKNGIDEKIEDFLQNSDELKKFIAFRKNNFYDYSIRNTILIYKQNPNATLVAGLKKWNELGYKVKKIETDLGSYGLRRSSAVDVYDMAALPEEFVRVTEERKADKEKIKEYIKTNGELKGARIVDNYSLQIRWYKT